MELLIKSLEILFMDLIIKQAQHGVRLSLEIPHMVSQMDDLGPLQEHRTAYTELTVEEIPTITQ